MGKYLFKRILLSIFALVVVMGIVSILIYSLMDREAIFATDSSISKLNDNERTVYKYEKWEKYSYLTFKKVGSYVGEIFAEKYGSDYLDSEEWEQYKSDLADANNYQKNPYIAQFIDEYKSKGYEMVYLPIMRTSKGGVRSSAYLLAVYEKNVFQRIGDFFGNLIHFETVNDVASDQNIERYVRFEWDNMSNMPCVVGSGTTHKYLLYFDNIFPYVHQNWMSINLGNSYVIYKNSTLSSVIVDAQGNSVDKLQRTPVQVANGIGDEFYVDNVNLNGVTDIKAGDYLVLSGTVNKTDNVYSLLNGVVCEKQANEVDVSVANKNGIIINDLCNLVHDNEQEYNNTERLVRGYVKSVSFNNLTNSYDIQLETRIITCNNYHTARYSPLVTETDAKIYTDNYINVEAYYSDFSRIENSFVIGIISTVIAYLLGLPIGIWMAKKKDKLVDKIGNMYIIFIMAVPSLAYIFIFAGIGTSLFGLPYKFANAQTKLLAYILPTISLALPQVGSLMKWMRRYMIDQMNSDYVKFARSQGLSEGEIFSKHIAPNALIYLVQGIPGSILACLTGAIITERVYGVPGVGNLLTDAISKSDNGIIIGCTFFYTFLSIVSLILGDLLLAKYDPRISFTEGGN